MKLNFISPTSLDKNLKATVHKSGKMGFTIEAANKMKLSPDKSLSIATNGDDETDKNLYIVVNDNRDSNSFSVLKAGDYYYVTTKELFKKLDIDYENNSVSFEISFKVIDSMEVFVFKTGIKERKSMNEKK